MRGAPWGLVEGALVVHEMHERIVAMPRSNKKGLAVSHLVGWELDVLHTQAVAWSEVDTLHGRIFAVCLEPPTLSDTAPPVLNALSAYPHSF
jgi:hypothetical protein